MSSVTLPVAFYFKVTFQNSFGITDTSFQEVSGISTEMNTEDIEEGGENRFVHKVPKGMKHGNLVMKRGVADINSPLIKWCLKVLEGDLGEAIIPQTIEVALLDETGSAVRSWSINNAYPVKWEIDSLDAKKNDIVIETLEFAYTYLKRIK